VAVEQRIQDLGVLLLLVVVLREMPPFAVVATARLTAAFVNVTPPQLYLHGLYRHDVGLEITAVLKQPRVLCSASTAATATAPVNSCQRLLHAAVGHEVPAVIKGCYMSVTARMRLRQCWAHYTVRMRQICDNLLL
jgi:hypothetical protein